MSASESCVAWKTDGAPLELMDVSSLVHDDAGFRILLTAFPPTRDPRILEVRFDLPRAYRVIDEGYRLAQADLFKAATHSLIYKVENSEFLAEFHRLSLGILQTFGIAHYLIVSANDCVDVLSETEPIVGWLGAGSDQ